MEQITHTPLSHEPGSHPADTQRVSAASSSVESEEDRRTRYEKELEELARRHEQEVARNVERAKDPSLYDTYSSARSESLPSFRLFAARRRGRSHVTSHTPCQDYCLTADTARGAILVNADGVGSCDRSDVGSRLACQVTVRLIRRLDRECASEKKLVERLCDPRFGELLVHQWLNAVLDHLEINPPPEGKSGKDYERYASTLMFALITKHYYVVGNLGDGQILLYNPTEGLKLRLHPPKESTRVRALIHPNCYREDLTVRRFERRDFSGILLCTDGMYDILCPGNTLFTYAGQLERRFLEADQPLMPFCFEEEGKPPKDLFCHRTKDDCSLVLAVDTAFVSKDSGRRTQIEQHADKALWEGLRGKAAMYLTEKNGQLLHTVATPRRMPVADPQKHSSFPFLAPLTRYTAGGLRYSVYPHADNLLTLDELFQFGHLREQKSADGSLRVLNRRKALSVLCRELEGAGLALNNAAPMLMGFDDRDRPWLLPEAVSPLDKQSRRATKDMDRFFSSLFGYLESEKEVAPVFRPGFVQPGPTRPLSSVENGPSFRVREGGGKLLLINAGPLPWVDGESGRTVARGEALEAHVGAHVSVSLPDGSTSVYRFIPKEEL